MEVTTYSITFITHRLFELKVDMVLCLFLYIIYTIYTYTLVQLLQHRYDQNDEGIIKQPKKKLRLYSMFLSHKANQTQNNFTYIKAGGLCTIL